MRSQGASRKHGAERKARAVFFCGRFPDNEPCKALPACPGFCGYGAHMSGTKTIADEILPRALAKNEEEKNVDIPTEIR